MITLQAKNRTAGKWEQSDLSQFATEVSTVPGNVWELGVFRGDSFSKTIKLMCHPQALRRIFYAVDSFRGMAPATAGDFLPGETVSQYPAGKLGIGGVQNFLREMEKRGVKWGAYVCVEGWVPQVLPANTDPIAWCMIDLDQYQPTKDAIDWAFPRLAVGGLLLLDDYYEGRDGYAGKAIDEWLRQYRPEEKMEAVSKTNHQLVIRKIG